MTLSLLAVAVVAGVALGVGLGALGGGGSILAVPVLVYVLGQTPTQATTGSLVVVGLGAVVGAVAARREGRVLLARGLAFGGVATGGAVLGARLSTHVGDTVLMASFSVLLLVVGTLMAVRLLHRNAPASRTSEHEPIVAFRPAFVCRCPRALRVLVTATGVGLLTGFLGVGGGFLVVPALVLALGLPVAEAAGTSLVVIAVTSTAALLVRTGSGVTPDWTAVAVLTAATVVGSLAGSRLASRTDPRRLAAAFTGLVLAVAAATALHTLPALV